MIKIIPFYNLLYFIARLRGIHQGGKGNRTQAGRKGKLKQESQVTSLPIRERERERNTVQVQQRDFNCREG